MPGIAGCIPLTTEPLPSETLSRLTRPLMHEPCYSVERIPCPAESVAAIINPGIDDLLCGVAQDAATGVSVGFYGEFYDPPCQAATRGDQVAGILLRKYLERDEEISRSLDGSYVVFITDPRRNRFLLCNDHYASRPVFYGVQEGRFCFSPEAKGVARMPGFDAGVDEDALVTFLICGMTLGEQTFFRNVKWLPPGMVLTIEDGRVTRSESSRYVPCGDSVDRGDDYYMEGLSALLMKAVGKHLRNLDKTFVPLSGGVDSRIIAGCIHRLTGEKMHTISWGLSEDLPDSDPARALEVARFLGADHHFVRREPANLEREMGEMIYRIDGLNTDPALHSNELSILRRMREELGGLYVLRGEEIFGTRPEALSDPEVLVAAGVARLEDNLGVERLLDPAKLPEFRDRSAQLIQGLLDACPCVNFTDRRDYFIFNVLQFHYHTRSAYFKRTVVDVRSPWMDREVMEFMATAPIRYRFNKYLYKKTVSAMFPELMAIPIAKRSNLENWPEMMQTNAALQQLLRTHLVDKRNSFHEILNSEGVRALYEQAIRPGGVRSSFKQRTLTAAKNFVRTRAPQLYRGIKPALAG